MRLERSNESQGCSNHSNDLQQSMQELPLIPAKGTALDDTVAAQPEHAMHQSNICGSKNTSITSRNSTCMGLDPSPVQVGSDRCPIGKDCLAHQHWEGQRHQQRVPIEDAASVVGKEINLRQMDHIIGT